MPGPKCCVKGCGKSHGKGARVFRVPCKSKPYQRKQWLQNAGLEEDDVPKDARFCEVHFTPDQFETLNFQGLTGLKSNAVPTRFLNDLPLSVDPEPQLDNENVIPGLRSPLSDRNQSYRNRNELTPVSKRRKAYSVCEDDRSEADRLMDSINGALKQAQQYKKMPERVSVMTQEYIYLFCQRIIDGRKKFIFGMRVKRF